MSFVKATRKKSRLRLAVQGPSGSGKTWGALKIAKGLGGKIAVVDTEKGSASIYANWVDFDVMELDPPYTPEAFIKAIKDAETGGYDVLIIDSATHEWSGMGGCLELVEQISRAKYKGNSWAAWNDITPRHRAFIDSITRSPMHIIVTMRSKTETSQVEENGRKKVVKLGMKAEQRDGSEYEFSVVLDIVHDGHYAQASKDRTGLFTDKDPRVIDESVGRDLLEWLESGEEISVPSGLMSEEEVEEHIGNITFAKDLHALKSAYIDAYKAATAANDTESQMLFTNAKNKMKESLDRLDRDEVADSIDCNNG